MPACGHEGAIVNDEEARHHLLRDAADSKVPPDELAMPDQWPVLAGSSCRLRVLDEADAPAWRADEGDMQLVWGGEFYGEPPPVSMLIRMARVGWAVGGSQRHWGVWTSPADRLAGGVQIEKGGFGGPDEGGARITWVIWSELFTLELAAEAVSLAAGWSNRHLVPGPLVGLADDDDAVSAAVLIGAGFHDGGPARPWEAAGRARTRYVL